MKTYEVWCPDLGSTREDAKLIKAYGPETAAETWAQWQDASSADYWIVGGTNANVVVLEGVHEHRFVVMGETRAVYYARAVTQQLPGGPTP